MPLVVLSNSCGVFLHLLWAPDAQVLQAHSLLWLLPHFPLTGAVLHSLAGNSGAALQVCKVCQPCGVPAGLHSRGGPPLHLLHGSCHCLLSQENSSAGGGHGPVLWVSTYSNPNTHPPPAPQVCPCSSSLVAPATPERHRDVV